MEEYLDRIIDILNEFNIRNIVSIDDGWKEDEEKGKKLDIDLYEFINLYSIEVTNNEQIIIDNEGIITIEELLKLNNEDINNLKIEVKKHIYDNESEDAGIESLERLFKEIVEKTYGDINIIKLDNFDIDFEDYKQNCLFILDKNMGGELTDIVVDSILQINKSSKYRNDLIIIYSNELTGDYDSQCEKLKYLERRREIPKTNARDLLLISYQIWGIEKTGDFGKLVENMNETLIKSAFGNSLYKAIQAKINIEDKTYNDLLKIDTYRLFNLANDSLIEGDTIIQSLERVFVSMKNRNIYTDENQLYYDSFRNLNTYEKINIKKIITSEPSYKKYRKNQLIKDLKASQKDDLSYFSVIDYNINRAYTDISTGDVFTIRRQNNLECGILITQACDCVIRILGYNTEEIERRAKHMKLLILDMEQVPENISQSFADKIQDKLPKYIWPVKIDKNNYVLEPTKEVYRIPSHILDLCSLNRNGQACIDFDMEESLKFKSYHSSRYFKEFKEEYYGDKFEEEGKRIQDILLKKSKQFSNEEIATALAEVDNEIFNTTISLKYGVNFKDNRFEINRIGRLELARTLMIIQNYANYLSMPGTDPVNLL